MHNPDERVDDPVICSYIRCVASIYDVAQRSLETQPLSMVLNFVRLTSSNVISLMPDGYESKRKEIQQYYIENMLILTFLAEKETWVGAVLFDELCETGFSSERRAVLCADHYCTWLKSRGWIAIIEEALAKVGVHIAHPYFKMELQAVAKRILHDGEATSEQEQIQGVRTL